MWLEPQLRWNTYSRLVAGRADPISSLCFPLCYGIANTVGVIYPPTHGSVPNVDRISVCQHLKTHSQAEYLSPMSRIFPLHLPLEGLSALAPVGGGQLG